MAVPIIVSVLPATGPAGGRTLVEIKANNLRLPDPQPETGPSQPRLPTVRVLFGTEEATEVKVYSQGRLTCLSPPLSPLLSPTQAEREAGQLPGSGRTDVTVTNLDNAGDPIAGETVTRTDGYRYLRPDLTEESDLTRLIRTLIRRMSNEVVRNVVLTQHTDYDESVSDTLNRIEIAEMPGLVLLGPELPENRFFSINERPVDEDGSGGAVIRRVPYTVDVEFEFVGVAEKKTTLLNMSSALINFFHRNKHLPMVRDPDNLALGSVRYEMELTEEPKTRAGVNNSNVRSFSGSMVIRGFDIEGLAGITNDRVVDEATEIAEDGVKINVTDNLGPNPDC